METLLDDDQNTQTHRLQERIKELQCLYDISVITANPHALLDQMIQEIADRIPSAFRQPEHTYVRLTLGPRVAQTANFESCPWKLDTPITSAGNTIGDLQIGYLGDVSHDGSPFLDEEKELLQMIAVHIGLIVRSNTLKEALIKSEDTLAKAQRIAHVGSWEWDIATGELHWTDETYRIFGFLPKKFGITYEAFLACIHPDDRPAVRDAVNQSLSDPNRPYSIEHRVVRSDGNKRVVHERGEVTFDANGTPVRMTGTVHDITELKLAEGEIRKLKDRLEEENIYLRKEIKAKESYGDIIGISDTIRYALNRTRKAARTKTTVLLTGETGTGKGIFARFLHQESDRSNKPFVNVNCAGLPANLIESELFGREKGAFTGSTARQIGRFELANGGTIFLDEIGELPFELQPKLLKVIEEGEFERLGSPHPVKVDARIVASTNRNLTEEIKNGRFREDLYFRLSVFPVSVPPLRERKGDIPLLVKAYTEKFGRSYRKDIQKFSKKVMESFENYTWPGNVRELINVIERAVIVSDGPELQLADKMDAKSVDSVREEESSSVGPQQTKVLAEAEREHILRALKETAWKIEGPRGAAALLGINPSTLRGRMRKLGIERQGGKEREIRSRSLMNESVD
jgi:formate hydrogenlyase transcriptional activator